MKVQRAQDILNSKGVIDVEYQGQPVWIQRVDPQNKTAEVGLVNTEGQKVVNVDELYETTIQ